MSTQKRTLASLKSAFAPADTNQPNNTNFTNNYFPFWNMKVGERVVVRFLPDANEENPRGFLVEKVFHNLEVNGQRRSIPCLTMYGDECPICKISQAYYKAKDEVNGKKYWKKKQHIAQVLVVEDPLPANEETGETHQGQVRYITLSFQLYNIIREAFASDELETIPYDYEDGYDFIIKKTEQGGYASYNVGTKFANKPRALTEEELSTVYDSLVDLATLLPKHPGEDKVQAMLDAELNGEEYSDDPSHASAPTPAPKSAPVESKLVESKPVESKPVESKPVESKPATTAAADEEEAESNQDVEDMLAQIRSRRANKA